MNETTPKRPRPLVVAGVAAALVLGVALAWTRGWLSPFGIGTQSSDSQVIQAVERTREVSLVSLGVQGIRTEKRDREIFHTSIPGTGETVIMQYDFTAKLGLDGAKVRIDTTGEHAYTLAVPTFTFIGYDKPTFTVALNDGGVLSWVTPDIDQVQMVTTILNDDARKQYLAKNSDLLKAQTQTFYDAIIKSVDPSAKTSYVFAS